MGKWVQFFFVKGKKHMFGTIFSNDHAKNQCINS